MYGEEQMENQIIEGYKTEENISTLKKEAHKKLMEDAALEEELGEKQSITEMCGKEIETYEKSEGKKQKSEQSKDENGKIIKDKKQYEEYYRKDSNSGVSRNKNNENESNIHKNPKEIIQTPHHVSKTRKESGNKDGGSTDEREAYQMKEKRTNRQGERKYNNHNQNIGQNESKITERLRTRSINK